MAEFLHDRRDFDKLLAVVADNLGLDPMLVEKDYWIMHGLWGLQAQGFVFELKGGTSLSKGFGVIHRFSEDIDIRIEPPADLDVKTGRNHDKPAHIASRRAYYDELARRISIPGIVSVERDTLFDDEKMRSAGSLADFSKMVEVFERAGVSFVSVTQQFNTTTSMGRLMLNVLLSFAQFEREVTGERIRDKITASKRKGMWMGGVPPLGYDVKDRRLIPNEREAKIIRHIFTRFVELGSSTKLVKELRMDGVTSKSWTTQDGKVREGKLIDKSLIYKLLGNRTYLGELRHKEEWFKGEHQPLIEISTWEAVQSILKVSPRTRGNYTRATIPFLLKGIIEGADGRALTAAWSRKGTGKLYRYYIHTRENKEHAGASGLPRLPAIELEANVVAQMRKILRAPDLKTRVAQHMTARDPQVNEASVCIAMLQIDKIWDQLFPAEQERIVRLLIKKVVVTPHNIEVQFLPNGLERLAAELNLPGAKEELEVAA